MQNRYKSSKTVSHVYVSRYYSCENDLKSAIKFVNKRKKVKQL